MAFDAFIHKEGIPGDSLDQQHKEWTERGGYRFGARQSISSSRSSGGSAIGGQLAGNVCGGWDRSACKPHA